MANKRYTIQINHLGCHKKAINSGLEHLANQVMLCCSYNSVIKEWYDIFSIVNI